MRSALVVDIDNTLFDWLAVWNKTFVAFLAAIEAHTDIDRGRLISAIAAAHQRVGTSEYAFLLQELQPLIEPRHCRDFAALADAATAAYRQARDSTLRVYPTVIETLRAIKSHGSRIIAFTESTAYHTTYRIKRLGMDGLLDVVYSAPDHHIPASVSIAALRRRHPQSYEFVSTRHVLVGARTRKPNPVLLGDILRAENVCASQAVYVGDSLVRDITMAQDAGVLDAYAAYGEPADASDLTLLQAVTHWSAAEIAEQRHTIVDVAPTIILRDTFAELLEHVTFLRHASTTRPPHGRTS